MMEIQGTWIIVQTKVNREHDVQRLLLDRGITAYLPLIEKKVKRFGKKMVLALPMFSGYVFVRDFSVDIYNLIRYCRGVQRILGTGQRILFLRDEIVQGIMSRETNGVVQLIRNQDPITSGALVVITDGPFEGWQGVFQDSLADGERVRILLTQVHFSTMLIVPRMQVTPVDGHL